MATPTHSETYIPPATLSLKEATSAALLDVIATAEDGIALLKDGKFIYLNKQHVKTFGYESASDLIGESWHTLYDQAEIEWFERYVMPQLMEVGYWRGQCRARRADGSFFDEDVWLKLLPNDHMACFCRDVTRINNLERESFYNLRLQNDLSEIEEKLLLFTSHELRTPLGGIGLLTDYLNEYGEELPRSELIKLIKDISNYVVDFRDLLERFRVFQATTETVRYTRTEQFNLETMAHELSNLLKEHYQKEIQIKIKAEGSMEVSSDRSIYKHILQNLISNAVKYSKDHTKIRIQLCNDGNFIYLTVKDQGIGIPLYEQDRIMEFMYRASNSEMANGSGVGLALVKQCVETLHGTISMQSKQNEGTTFNIILPLKLSS